MRVYLSGAITGDPWYEAKFAEWETKLRAQHYDVVNPVMLGHHPDASDAQRMRNDVRALVDCEYIAMIPGWEVSNGAKLEFQVATMCGMGVLYL